jgi:hypothetical protein
VEPGYMAKQINSKNPKPTKLPPRQSDTGYVRPPSSSQTFVPDHYER